MSGGPVKERVVRYALEELGFDVCRCVRPFLASGTIRRYRSWLARGRHGEMRYLERHAPLKEDPTRLLPGVRSAVVVAKSYRNTSRRRLAGDLKIARYAAGKDYHFVMAPRLRRLAAFLQGEAPKVRCYWGVDSRPIAERSLALGAGVGFLGKNTMVIRPGLGSYFVLGVVLTTLDLEPDPPLGWDCGQCRLCLDACPTGAFPRPYELDATRCISYWTIERRKPLPAEAIRKTDGWLFGCDVCQEVCPYNHGAAPLTDWPEFRPEAGVGFEVFQGDSRATPIPKGTPLFRDRRKVRSNWESARSVFRGETVSSGDDPFDVR